MSLRGNLNSVDLANIFQMLSINQKEGTLNIFDGDSKKSIYFSRDGVSMLSRGKAKKDTLGRILLRYDRLSETQLDRALEKQRQSGRLLGAILEESRLVPREIIEDALRIQIEEEIYNLFIWKDASFEFIEGVAPKEFDEIDGTITRLTFNVNSLIMEAARRIDEWEQIQRAVPSTNEVYQYTGRNMELTDDVFREPYSEKVLACINGRNTVEETIEQSYVNKFEVFKILSLLIEQHAIEPVGPDDLADAAEAALAASEAPAAIKFLNRLLELGRDGPETHLALGRAHEAQNELSRAAVHFRKYAEARLAAGGVQDAYDVYRHLSEILPTDLQAAERMIEIYVSHQERVEGQPRLVIEKGKSLATVFLEIGKNNRAVQTLHRVITLDPEDFALRNLLVNIYLANNMSSEAIAEYEAMAEWYARQKDWAQVIKVLRKILVIDRNREDVNQRLQHLLTRKEKKAKNLRRLLLVSVIVLGLSVLAYGYIGYELDARREAAETEAEAAEMLKTLNTEVQPIREQLVSFTQQLQKGNIDVDQLIVVYKKAEQLQRRYEEKIKEAVAQLERVAVEYKFARAKEEAVERTRELEQMRAAFESSVATARRELQARAIALVDEADKAVKEGQATKALERYRKAWNIAIDRAPLQARSVEEKIRSGEALKSRLDALFEEMDRKLVSADYAGAREAGHRLIEEYFAAEVLTRVSLPVKVDSRPAGAKVYVNGVDSGITTPGYVLWHPGVPTEIALEKPGFTTAVESIPAARVEIPDRERARILALLAVDRHLKKEIEFQGAVDGAVQAVPASLGDQLLLATRSSRLWRVDVKSREKTLLHDAKSASVSGFHAGPVVAGESAFLATVEGLVRRVSLATGEVQWERQNDGGMIYAPLALADGSVISGDVGGNLVAWAIADGRSAWTRRLDGEIRARPAVAGGRVYALTTTGRLYAYKIENGELAFEREVGPDRRPLFGSPVVVGEHLYVGSTAGRIHVFTVKDGRELEPIEVGSEIRGDLVASDDVVFATTTGGSVIAIRGQSIVDRLEIGGTLTTAATVSGPRVAVVSDAGRLVAAEFADGKFQIRWTYELRTAAGTAPAVEIPPVRLGELLVVVAESGEFFVLAE